MECAACGDPVGGYYYWLDTRLRGYDGRLSERHSNFMLSLSFVFFVFFVANLFFSLLLFVFIP